MAEISIAKETTAQSIKTKVDSNLDATVSSRQPNVLSQTQANRLDDTISSRMPGTTTHRDRIDTTISSRQAAWGATTTHSSRIDTTISSRAAQTTANTINTNVGSNADASSATGSVHAKLKDVKSAITTSIAKPIGGWYTGEYSTASTSWQTALSVSGKQGRLVNIALKTSSNSNARAKIFIDGVDVTASTDNEYLFNDIATGDYRYFPRSDWFISGITTNIFQEMTNLDLHFKNSLVIQLRSAGGFASYVKWFYQISD